MELTHFNEQGRARMVDVSEKPATYRMARACATVRMARGTMEHIRAGQIGKGDVLAVAQVAGIMAAKKNAELIPMCHPLLLTKADITFRQRTRRCTSSARSAAAARRAWRWRLSRR